MFNLSDIITQFRKSFVPSQLVIDTVNLMRQHIDCINYCNYSNLSWQRMRDDDTYPDCIDVDFDTRMLNRTIRLNPAEIKLFKGVASMYRDYIKIKCAKVS